ncbi:hypothetical protein BpHYR1_046051 [Brachionus plicatilis]|uniref:Uncharacterized protein n=1 Tax=Brachionus plicatilis TaxID=10195 RepID=A0A3M7R020_BRAPC|nr:hypothetical protein BpHYR1_046051 [Brachionus plicatilis]
MHQVAFSEQFCNLAEFFFYVVEKFDRFLVIGNVGHAEGSDKAARLHVIQSKMVNARSYLGGVVPEVDNCCVRGELEFFVTVTALVLGMEVYAHEVQCVLVFVEVSASISGYGQQGLGSFDLGKFTNQNEVVGFIDLMYRFGLRYSGISERF